jgi:hypothetical protein
MFVFCISLFGVAGVVAKEMRDGSILVGNFSKITHTHLLFCHSPAMYQTIEPSLCYC